jgi:hypothetical protein
MKIEGLGPPQQPEPNSKKADEAKRASNPIGATKNEPDKIDLGRSDKDQSGVYTSSLKQGAGAIQDRPRNLDLVRAQSDNGYYDSPQARSETSDKLIDSDDFREVVQEYHSANRAADRRPEIPGINSDKISDIRQKAASGFYNDPANFGAFVDKIIKRFGL